MTPRSPAALAGALGLFSLGLPWGTGPGAVHPARVAVVAALALTLVAVRTGRGRLLLVAAAVAGVGGILGGLDATPGRLALLGAAVTLVAAYRWTMAADPHAPPAPPAPPEAGDPLRTGRRLSGT